MGYSICSFNEINLPKYKEILYLLISQHHSHQQKHRFIMVFHKYFEKFKPNFCCVNSILGVHHNKYWYAVKYKYNRKIV